MKTSHILVFSLLLGWGGTASVHAQMAFDQDELKKLLEETKAKDAENNSGSRRRDSGAGAQGKGADPLSGATSWEDWAKLKGQMNGAPKETGPVPQRWEDLLGSPGGQNFARGGVKNAVQKILKKQITVISGTRVTDALTGELLDDAREIRVDEDKKSEYFDDGTHGDLVAGDGKYTKVEEIEGVIGPNNQRIKEQLIQALYEASRLDAREFYGHTLMSTDHSTRPERNMRWALTDAPENRVGFRISEIATERTVEVPSFWEEEKSRDLKIAGPNGWARTFLDEFRVEKGGLTSSFYTPYVPNPPTIPKIPPPSAEGWTPFVQGYSEEEGIVGGSGGGGKAGGAANGFAGLEAAELAKKFVNRGAGKGSTSKAGGYFGG